MKQQPCLTNFPSHVFATAKRRQQAAIRNHREQMASQSLSGYGVLFNDVLSGEFLTSVDTTARQRLFGHRPTFWAWAAQILEGNSSCSKALGLIQGWYRSLSLPVPASDSSGYCKARSRLSDDFMDAVSDRILTRLRQQTRSDDLWNEFTLKAIDGSSVQLMDTEENQKVFPQPSSQKKGCGFPVMGIAGLLNLSHGGWDAFETAPFRKHDLFLGHKLLRHVGKGDLLLADRAYCSYGFIASILAGGGHAVMRLHQQREGKLDWRKGKKISPYERLVTWRRPPLSARSKQLTEEQWNALPEELNLRLIKLNYEDRSGAKRSMIVVTTLTDAVLHDGLELFCLYARRWQIELKLRDIKTTLGFEFINVRTPAMAVKTLKMVQIAYNLLRVLMQRAAVETDEPVHMVSFKGALDTVTSLHETFRPYAAAPRKRAEHRDFLMGLLGSKLINHRPFRSEPRAVKRRPKPFALLTAPRHEYVETSHRSTYRKAA